MSEQDLWCVDCGREEIPSRRYGLGYRTCLKCGELKAKAESLRKSKAVATLHKGNSVYLGTGKGAAQYAKDIAQMRRGVG